MDWSLKYAGLETIDTLYIPRTFLCDFELAFLARMFLQISDGIAHSCLAHTYQSDFMLPKGSPFTFTTFIHRAGTTRSGVLASLCRHSSTTTTAFM